MLLDNLINSLIRIYECCAYVCDWYNYLVTRLNEYTKEVNGGHF